MVKINWPTSSLSFDLNEGSKWIPQARSIWRILEDMLGTQIRRIIKHEIINLKAVFTHVFILYVLSRSF